ncbi:hypothetical protein BOTU111921_06795 [Bordetella tumbae]
MTDGAYCECRQHHGFARGQFADAATTRSNQKISGSPTAGPACVNKKSMSQP